MLIGCDGGFYATYDRGETWDHLNILALGQFYHVAVDNKTTVQRLRRPAGQRQLGRPVAHASRHRARSTTTGSSSTAATASSAASIRTTRTSSTAESQGGAINRRNLRTGESRFIGARPVKQGEPLRFNWNTPFILSSHNPRIFYSGAQYVFRSINKGENLKAISPDLTTSKKGTISAIAESPRNADVLWVGTDDGNLWVTKDGGTKWDNVLDKLKAAGLPGPRWVSSIEPSRVAGGGPLLRLLRRPPLRRRQAVRLS